MTTTTDHNLPPLPQSKVQIQTIRDGGVVLRLVKVRCGKINCTKCPHGPYWYAYYWRSGKWREIYIGRNLVKGMIAKHMASNERLARLEEIEALTEESHDDLVDRSSNESNLPPTLSPTLPNGTSQSDP